MLRFILGLAVSLLVLASDASCRADDAEDRAATYLEKLRGVVTRDTSLPGKPIVEVILFGKPSAWGDRKQPRNLVDKVNREGKKSADIDLKGLRMLKNLGMLSLNDTDVTDVGLKELTQLKSLTELVLSSKQVTDVGIREVAQLKNLTSLYLSCQNVTEMGLKELAPLKNLTELYLLQTLEALTK